MRSVVFILAICVLLVSEVLADPVGTAEVYGSGAGKRTVYGWTGEILVRISGLPVAGDEFRTFCLERKEDVVFGQLNDVTLSTEALAGGTGHSDVGPLGGDLLSPKTAWLYDQYLLGNLGHDNYVARDVQLAIWYIENEITNLTGYAAAQALVAQAQGSSWADTGLCRVLNVWEYKSYPPGEYLQDFIVKIVPVPGAILLGLLGLTAAGLRLRKNV